MRIKDRADLFVSLVGINDVVNREQYRADILEPFRANRHGSRKTSIEAGCNPSGTVI